jgi:hypothetical protein
MVIMIVTMISPITAPAITNGRHSAIGGAAGSISSWSITYTWCSAIYSNTGTSIAIIITCGNARTRGIPIIASLLNTLTRRITHA